MMIPDLIETEVNTFRLLNGTPLEIWLGKSPTKWAKSVAIGLEQRSNLPASPLSRSELRALWKDYTIATEACVISTLAWGGMQYRHARTLWDKIDTWLPHCDEVRSGKHNRKSGFEAFSQLHQHGNTPGMGPAYYTKILFFASPNQNSYILDQWTTRSLHLLTGQSASPPCLIDHESKKKAQLSHEKLRLSVAGRTTSEEYETYCQRVEQLAAMLNIHPHATEEMLFSAGGRSPHPWRKHVMQSWEKKSPMFYC